MKPYIYFPIDRQKLADAMIAFAYEKPGFDKTNYHSESSYKSDYNVYKKSADENRRNLRNPQDYAFFYLAQMDDNEIHDAFRSAYSGRLSINENMSLEYTAGQYWCTEYQQALESVVDRLGTVAYYGPQNERFYDMSTPDKGHVLYNEHDLGQSFIGLMDENEKIDMVKRIWGETTQDGYTGGGARNIVRMEEYSGLNNLLKKLPEVLDNKIGIAIEGLREKGWCLNGFQEIERMYEITYAGGNKELLNEYDFNQRAQELTGLSSSDIGIAIKSMRAVKDQGIKAEKLEYFPKYKCYAKLEDQSVKTIAPEGKRWTDATKKAVIDPQFKEAVVLRFGGKADFLTSSTAVKVMQDEILEMASNSPKDGTVKEALASLESLNKSQNLELK